MNIKLEIAKKVDYKKIAEIYSEEFSKPPFNERWNINLAIKKINLFSKYCEIYKVTETNKIIGFIIINSNQWFPGEVIFGEDAAIKKEYQNKGIGKKVFESIFEKYGKKGYKRFMGIANRNSRSVNLYKRLGIIESKESILIEKELKPE